MKKKLLSKTYLKGVDKYNIYFYLGEEDEYVCVKEILHIDKPFISKEGKELIKEGYYIVEILPKNKNYAVRIFVNPSMEKLLYYFDITLENGLDKETLIPFYDDLYLDVVLEGDKIYVLDENELEEAFEKNNITYDQYNLAIEEKNKLIQSILKKQNKYLNIDLNKYIR